MREPSHSRPPRAPSWVEVDLTAFRHNIRRLRALLDPSCQIWAVVKANAYGHGATPTARAVLDAGATGLAVASVAEGAALRRAGVTSRILVLAAGQPAEAGRAVRLGLSQTVCSIEIGEALSRAAGRLGKAARVHMKVDTGMGRLGVSPAAAVDFARRILTLQGLHLEGVFSHLASAEDPDASYSYEQFERFSRVLAGLSEAGVDSGMRHLANSAATLRFPDMRLDAVRVGLLVYGLRPDAPDLEPFDLRPALTWKTRLAFVHRLAAGSPVSYGGTYVTPDDRLVGVLPLGYADGYPRHASNRAQVLVKGEYCPVIGTVCMDHILIDLSPVEVASAGDEVVLIGQQGNACITANTLAQWAGTVVHAVPTLIGSRVARVYVDREEPHGRNPSP